MLELCYEGFDHGLKLQYHSSIILQRFIYSGHRSQVVAAIPKFVSFQNRLRCMYFITELLTFYYMKPLVAFTYFQIHCQKGVIRKLMIFFCLLVCYSCFVLFCFVLLIDECLHTSVCKHRWPFCILRKKLKISILWKKALNGLSLNTWQ